MNSKPSNIIYTIKHFDELTNRELYSILKLRTEIFVVEQDCVYNDMDDRDQQCYHILGKDTHNDLLVHCRLVPKGVCFENYSSIGRVVIDQRARGTKEGHVLIQLAIEETLKRWPNFPIKISAQAHLEGFYGRHGFIGDGEIYLEDGIPHRSMIRNL